MSVAAMDETPATARRGARLGWIDEARGLLILLVVIGHAWRGLEAAGLLPPALFEAVDRRIYAFHMPAFFLLSGWFYLDALSHTQPGPFLKGRLLRLAWPMVVWTYLFLGVKLLAGSLANDPVSADDLLVSPVPGVLHLWFLWSLLLMSVALMPLRVLSRSDLLMVLALGAVAALAVAAHVRTLPHEWAYWFAATVAHLPFFVLGAAIGRFASRQGLPVPVRAVAAVSLLGVLAAAPPEVDPDPLDATSVAAVLLFVATMAGGSPRLGRGLLARLGRASMAIYLAHTIFSAAARSALLAAGVVDPAAHMALGVAAGVAGPLLLLLTVRGTWAGRVLGL